MRGVKRPPEKVCCLLGCLQEFSGEFAHEDVSGEFVHERDRKPGAVSA
jgi:hypothetical protein